MKVLVTGGRHFADFDHVCRTLDKIHKDLKITLLIEGGATGADRLARRWAVGSQVPVQTFEANWARYRGRAGLVRNCQMLREGKPDMVVAFQGNTGTHHMMKIAEDAVLPVFKMW